MSWTLNVSATPRAEFDQALDDAQPTGQDAPGVAEAVEAAKTAAKALAALVHRDNITAALNGHVLQPDEGPNWYDGVTVSVHGS